MFLSINSHADGNNGNNFISITVKYINSHKFDKIRQNSTEIFQTHIKAHFVYIIF